MRDKLTEDIIKHLKMLNIEDDYLTITYVHCNLTERIKDLYRDKDEQGYYELYKLIVELFEIETVNHFTTD